MYSNKLYSPLRYPGGKAPFAPYIAKVMETNGVSGGHYLEPYAGGAGVALELLFHGHASHIHINDADPAVYSFWISRLVLSTFTGFEKAFYSFCFCNCYNFSWNMVFNPEG